MKGGFVNTVSKMTGLGLEIDFIIKSGILKLDNLIPIDFLILNKLHFDDLGFTEILNSNLKIKLLMSQ